MNIGNTCSINSLLQCIAHSTVLRRFLTEYKMNVTHQGSFSITAELVELVREMWTEGSTKPVVPRRFLQAFFEKASYISHGEQHDICEVWMILCEAVAKECASPQFLDRYNVTPEEAHIWRDRYGAGYARAVVQYSQSMKQLNKDNACMWLELLQGVMIAQVSCSKCNEVYHNFEPFTTLSLDIAGPTLLECFNALLCQEELHDWMCDKCSHRGNAVKVVQFWKLPAVLCISLRRFTHHAHGIAKNSTPVQIANTINIPRKSIVGPQRLVGPNGPNGPDIKYKLRGIGLHHGCLGGGHYTAIGVCENGGKIVECDDDFVREPDITSTDNAYFIIYDISQR